MITASDLADDDTDTEGDSLTVTGVSNPSGGTVVLDAGDDHLHARPPTCAATTRPASTTRSRTATAAPRPGTVTIDLTCENDAPVAGDDTVSVTEDTATDVTGTLLDNDTDVDAERHAVDHRRLGPPPAATSILDGGVVTFTPSADLCGTGEGGFDYERLRRHDDRLRATSPSTSPASTTRPTAVDDDASGTEDTDVVITAADLAADDTDVDPGDSLTVTAVSNPSGGTVSLTAGTITFVPTANLCGDDAASFDYTVEDGNGGSDTGTVTIDLTCVNDAPDAVNDTASVVINSGRRRPRRARQRHGRGRAATPSPSSRPCSTRASGTASVVSRQGPLHAAGRLQRPGRDHVHRQRRRRHRHRHAHDHRGRGRDRPGRRGPDRRLRHRPGRRDGPDQGLLVGHGRPVRRRLVRSAGERRRGLVQGPLRRHRHLDHQALRLQAAPGLPGPGEGHPRQLVRVGQVLGAQDRRLPEQQLARRLQRRRGPA